MIYILMGVSGCGKTTIGQMLCAKLGWPLFDADEFHTPASIDKMRNGIPLEDSDRWPWLDRMNAALGEREARGESVSLMSVHTVKPLDIDGVQEALMNHKWVVVIEQMAPYGGLGPRVKEIALDAKATCRIDSFALQDAFIHNYGSHADLLAAHGLDIKSISAKLGLS